MRKINKIFIFSMIWTVAAVVDGPGRVTCASFMKKLFADKIPGTRNKSTMCQLERNEYPPDGAPYFDYYLSEDFKWRKWEYLLEDPDEINLVQKY
jgi:hypothetical protein